MSDATKSRIQAAARVLVVTPTLGESPFLPGTVASIEALPLDVLHVVSAPESKLASLRSRFPRARVLADAGKAGGIYGALNRALENAPDGWDWFTYINDDDELLPAFAEVTRRHCARRDPEAVVYGDVEMMDPTGAVIARVTVERDPAWLGPLLQEGISPLMQQGMLFSRETVRRLGGFDLRYRLCADLEFWLRAHAAGCRFRHYSERVARFRIHEGQLSGDTETTRREQDEIVGRLLPGPVPQWRRTFARLHYRAANLPRYLARIRKRGFKRSYELLEGKERA